MQTYWKNNNILLLYDNAVGTYRGKINVLYLIIIIVYFEDVSAVLHTL